MSLSKARILITNDDGINAPGLKILEKIMKSFSQDVWVVAPESEQSASAHSLTLTLPLRIRQIGKQKYAVGGTPTDSVLLAVKNIIFGKRPDFLISGVNAGLNLGDDITYSGTVAAAMEGALLGIPSIAISQSRIYGKKVRWNTTKKYAPSILEKLSSVVWSSNVFMNVNFPDVSGGDLCRVVITEQGRRKIGESLISGRDPRGDDFVWIGTQRKEGPLEKRSDVKALKQDQISITPLTFDLTHRRSMNRLKELFK